MSSNVSTSTTAAPTRLHRVSRVLAAVVGGYVFAWGVVAALTASLFAAGVEFHDAEFIGAICGVLTYLCVFLWSIAARRLGVVWALLLGGGFLLTATASLIQSMLL